MSILKNDYTHERLEPEMEVPTKRPDTKISKCLVHCLGCESGDPEKQKCISSQVEELFKQIDKMRNCYNCKYSDVEYDHVFCDFDNYKGGCSMLSLLKWELKESM